MRQNTSILASGTLGNNVVVNTTVASFVNVPVGRYRLTGSARHTVADGLKITGIPGGTLVIPGGPGDTIVLPSIVFDLTAVTTINVALNIATGASDTASALMCLELANH